MNFYHGLLADRFWSYFINLEFIVGAMLLYIPILLLAFTANGGGRLDTLRWRRTYYVAIGLGVFSSVMPYIHNAYPNLSRSVGGGCPLLAEIDLSDGQPVRPSAFQTFPRMPRLGPATRPATGPHQGLPEWEQSRDALGRYVVFPVRKSDAPATQPSGETLLLWHETDTFVYVTRLAGWGQGTLVMAIPKDNVAMIRYRQGILQFRHGRLERALVNVDFEEFNDAMLTLLVDLKDAFNEKAATQPAVLTPELQRRLEEINKRIEAAKGQ